MGGGEGGVREGSGGIREKQREGGREEIWRQIRGRRLLIKVEGEKEGLEQGGRRGKRYNL